MVFDTKNFLKELEQALKVFEFKKAAALCNAFVTSVTKMGEHIPIDKAEGIVSLLGKKRMFAHMANAADALLRTGHVSYKLQRMYAQSLIENRQFTAAASILQSLVAQTGSVLITDFNAQAEHAEAKGLLGRLYKQLYADANNATLAKNAYYLTTAIGHYYDVYKADASKTWHGINAVALIMRAEKDGIGVPVKEDPLEIARTLLKHIQKLYAGDKATAWDFATAAEACLALGEIDESLQWLGGYARMPYCDAFELASTLRQFEEIWQLDLSSEAGQYLLPLLQSELVKRSDGTLVMDVGDVLAQMAIGDKVAQKYEALADGNNKQGKQVKLEKVFGSDSFKTYQWYMKGASRCLAVARIGIESSLGLGTGFLMRGEDLKESWGDELVLLTNAHVVSKSIFEKSIRPDEAVVIFEVLDSTQEFRNLKIEWSSPSRRLDATVLRFSAKDKERLEVLTKNIELYPVSKYLPVIENPPSQQIYIIGHPKGGTLQISFQDNLLIDHDSKSKIHYRTPTEGGSSGSPVFNRQWDLIGLHHAGSDEMECLNNKPGKYEANEGIWIQAIRKELEEENL